MNTALCLTGTGRSIEHTFDNLKEYLIDDIDNHDVIVYLTKNSKSDIAKKYFNKLDNAIVHVVEEHPIPVTDYNFHYRWPPKTSSREIFIQMIKSRSYMNKLIDQTDKKYNRVIFSRMDVVYEKPVGSLIENLDLSKIWIPDFHNYGGYNDRFAVSTRENMFNYFSLYDNIEEYMSHGHLLRAETSMKYHLDTMNSDVKTFDIKFVRIKGNGEPVEDFSELSIPFEGY